MVFGFDSKYNGKSLEGLSRVVSDGICLIIFKIFLWLLCEAWSGGGSRSRETVGGAAHRPGKQRSEVSRSPDWGWSGGRSNRICQWSGCGRGEG